MRPGARHADVLTAYYDSLVETYRKINIRDERSRVFVDGTDLQATIDRSNLDVACRSDTNTFNVETAPDRTLHA